MTDELTLIVKRCLHGAWHRHNALRLDDGSVVDDPEGQCPGGIVRVGERTFGISHAFAMFLDAVSEGTEPQ